MDLKFVLDFYLICLFFSLSFLLKRPVVSDPVSNIMEEMRAPPASTSPNLSQASQAQQERSAAAKRMEERAAEQERRRREAVSTYFYAYLRLLD